MTATKHVTVVVAGGDGRKYEVEVSPSTEVRDILEQLNLKDYSLSTGQNAPVLADTQLPFIFVEDGGKLHATPRGMSVGE